MIRLDSPVQYVKGVGPRRAAMLEKAGIRSAEDLLKYRPFRYEDRTRFRRIKDLLPDQETVVQAEVLVTGFYTTPMKRVRIFEMLVGDGTGSLQVKFFNQVYLDKVFRKGQQVILFGSPKADAYSVGLQLLNPDFEILDTAGEQSIHTGRIVPVYRRIGQLTTKTLRHILFGLLQEMPEPLEDPLPDSLLQKYSFPDRRTSFRLLHFPEVPDKQPLDDFLSALDQARTPFQRRFVFEEFFFFQLGLQVLRRQRELAPKTRQLRLTPQVREAVKKVLPFHPTAAQKRVLKQIVGDLSSPKIMNRLLQGDVGSGKTIVALQAMIVAVENGAQAALMAPTEILAEQHYRTMGSYLSNSPYRLALLTSSVKGKKRTQVLESVRAGETHLLIGTHALIEGRVEFKDLALVVVDEQHRFGVMQRSEFMEKGDRPDTLVMTATPIPRSLALTLYGDLDLSIIDQMPPGRQPVLTLVRKSNERAEVYETVRRELEQGRQAYIVYPLIEQSEKLDLRAATEGAEYLHSEIFPEFQIGLMHGRLKSEEKDNLMTRFKAGEIQVLVSTTVIEVGIDVPNATIMLVEHADRFGLSQLHQLRGRIGRGRDKAICILLTEGFQSREAFERLEIMRRTNNGFKIAEKDLELRGPGEFVGTRQSGLPEFLFGNIVRDRDLLEMARADAESYFRMADEAGEGFDPEALAQLATWWKQRYGLYQVG
ncbi:MAG: ATP-dependent DNA helicase RecG [Acidobacteria bacterium]|nr:MAG: ATP-dependent DNA helicase RecG [Acidobacteriota bacterium]